MYAIVHNNLIHLGPMPWRKTFFENCLLEDLEISAVLPSTYSAPIEIDPQTKILPVEMLPNPNHNPKTQGLDGPYWDIQSDKAVGHYTVRDLPIDLVQGQLKELVAKSRWVAEVGGTKITLQGQELSVDTSREGRSIYLQAFQLGSTGATWKFPEGWVVLSNAELGQIVQAIMTHVQAMFTWEADKGAEIMGNTTLTDLDAVVTDYAVH